MSELLSSQSFSDEAKAEKGNKNANKIRQKVAVVEEFFIRLYHPCMVPRRAGNLNGI